ncbi:MAG: bifunctional 4-hydroxy-2-oxoglutarate aldolase/2-dehydro-3-deoxy-phosphogluconate aldolase [Clostridiales bacterium]|nr:bifunctional 4-hydroxy-2-oxoglutarate aldolase/2-dehydro-3-deoxy-phosphogluconate aldolase [Clostridiales bacterium]
MKKFEIYQAVKQEGVVVVIRGDSVEQAIKTVESCYAGGIKIMEVTFTVPNADQIIKTLVEKYKGTDMIVGAGTVLDPETARAAILAGAQFVVSPALNVETIKLCNRYGVAVMSGIFTPTEAITALEYGVDILKLFPGDVATPKGLKALKGPLPQANIMPTGGVSLENVEEWFKAGAYAVGAGSFITKGAKSGDYKAVEDISREFVNKVKAVKGNK